jgi:hypothetical protein
VLQISLSDFPCEEYLALSGGLLAKRLIFVLQVLQVQRPHLAVQNSALVLLPVQMR